MGGTALEKPPFTGNGFTAARDDIIPEYRIAGGSIQAGAEIWEINSVGQDRLIATFDGETWIPVMG